MEKLKSQVGKLGDIIFDAETGATYKQAVTLTWEIVRETGLLLWLTICLVFVGAEGFWQKSIALGRASRNWYEGLQAPKETESKSATEMGQSALSALGLGAKTLLYQAKQQLDIEAEPPAPKPRPTEAKAAPTPEPAPVKPTEPAIAAVAAESKSESSTPESITAKSETAAAAEELDADDD